MEGGQIKGHVLDTSVVVKWFSEADESDLEKALELRTNHIAGHCLLIAPDLLLYELANALRHNEKVKLDDVRQAVESVFEIDVEIKPFDSAILHLALTLAFKHQVTVYDAYFLALAETNEWLLVTADSKFYKKVRDSKWIRKLSDL